MTDARWLARLRAGLLPAWTRTARALPYGPDARQVLDVMRPRWPGAAPRPVVVALHGGGWTAGSRAALVVRVCRRYLERGFLVVNVEYRGELAAAAADASCALEWTFDRVASYGGDPARVFVTGESAGAHLALVAAFKCRRRVRAAINFFAVTDLVGYLRAHDPFALGADEQRRLSPLELVTPEVCPVLSIHGTADTVVPLHHALALTRRLHRAGVAAQQLIVDGGGHGFTEAQLDTAYAAIFRFVRARVEPVRESRIT